MLPFVLLDPLQYRNLKRANALMLWKELKSCKTFKIKVLIGIINYLIPIRTFILNVLQDFKVINK